MPNILGQLLPMLGAGAQGFMQGTEAGTNLKQIRQLTAMREAKEQREALAFPISQEAGELQNLTTRQTYDQSEEIFPMLQRGRELDISNQEHLQGPADSGLIEVLRRAGMDFSNIPGLQHQDALSGAGYSISKMLEGGRNYRAITPRPTSGKSPFDQKLALLKIYESSLDPVKAMEAAYQIDPDIAAKFKEMNMPAVQFRRWILSEIQKIDPNFISQSDPYEDIMKRVGKPF